MLTPLLLRTATVTVAARLTSALSAALIKPGRAVVASVMTASAPVLLATVRVAASQLRSGACTTATT
jgi:hypothetical protein